MNREELQPLPNLIAVILAYNEEIHVARAIDSVAQVAGKVVVVDSGSTDNTVAIAEQRGAFVLKNAWVNYASQFNWALSQIAADGGWIFRLDADEVVSAELARSVRQALAKEQGSVDGFLVQRRMSFLGRSIKWGGVFPVRVLRVFRNGLGHCEERWMDEHIVVDGVVASLKGELLDDNKKSITWWTDKHNWYASREAVDCLNLELGFSPHGSVASLHGGGQPALKRWMKENLYQRLPIGLRALSYFVYRYVLRLGFLDGLAGTAFHVLQGFWYRYLVDVKIYEVQRFMKERGVEAPAAIREVLGIDVRTSV